MSNALAPRPRGKCLGALRMICGQQALLPRSLQITPHYNQSGRPRYSSGRADLWEGEYQDRKVAVKVLKMSTSSDLDKITKVIMSKAFRRCEWILTTIMQRFCKGVIMCRSLNHSNVLPLLGATMYNGRFTVISTWMDNGNINDFVRDRESVNLFELVGSSYYCQLHSPLIILLVAQRCFQRVNISARAGSDTWGFEGGMVFAIGN